MSKAWITEKLPEFVRDMLRDFCLAADILESQFTVFDQTSQVSFEVLHDLLGEEMNKGLLWRLKDTAHHLFRNDGRQGLSGQMLDWCIGYIFHETMKIKEDAYQQQNYGPWFRELLDRELPEAETVVSKELFQIVLQTNESLRREAARVRFFFEKCRRLLMVYLSDQGENPLLGRFLFEQNPLVRKIFGQDYDALIAAIYGDAPEMMYVMASQSLRQGGWMTHAAEAVGKACELGPVNQRVLRERQIVDTWAERIKT
ncbi:hypothetical protein [Fundidesulfovibrio terrae]|uniref:hypothetical protein n=1 Tax=Fundidesulfovibrio terrae TaxID=2922866 RepID=UPI001FAF7C79|nr:hypothetical protein [Fundidesulfovibrio terrae]